jgi:hypothetical protein
MSSMDFYLFYDEDQDIDTDEMSEFTPVEPTHLLELHQRDLLALREVFSHKGWHHKLTLMRWKDTGDEYNAQMWDGPTGEEYWCHNIQSDSTWG